ncbi:hypothetical protein ZWY2020_053943 [Hordeum vulgare]|nr:hypothetical protein ZWY2020_053943 [Hordeum vulgare]
MIGERKVVLEENRVKIATNAEDTKMLTLIVDSLDVDPSVIVQTYRYQMLQRQKDELAVVDYEDAMDADAEANEEVAYAVATTSP